MNRGIVTVGILFVGLTKVIGQGDLDVGGISVGPLLVSPEVSALVAYDSRVLQLPGGAEEDYYGEGSIGFSARNRPALYRFSADGSYGYRSYSEYSEFDDDFYSFRASLGTDQTPLTWGLSASHRKSLDYNTSYNLDTGEGPDPILDARESIRTLVSGNVAYEASFSERFSARPQYQIQHYDQEFDDPATGTEEAEWQIHRAILELRRRQSEKTVFTAGGVASFQTNRDEDGQIATVYVGGESQVTDKTSWEAKVGVSAADYENSGTDVAGVSDLRIRWGATDKVSAYVFGGNRFLPGYQGGPARLVYRLGYGADWRFAERWSVDARVLHDYEEGLNDTTVSLNEELRTFFDTRLSFNATRSLRLSLNGRYVSDERDDDQMVASLQIDYRR